MEFWAYYRILKRRRWLLVAALLAAIVVAIAANRPQVGDFDSSANLSVPSMQRFFFASGIEAELDKQGRIVIPANLLESAGIGRDVTVAGIYDHLEIWDRAAWRDQRQTVEGSAEDVAERLANRD